MTAQDFHNIYRELIDENPLAIRAVLKVLPRRVHRHGADARHDVRARGRGCS